MHGLIGKTLSEGVHLEQTKEYFAESRRVTTELTPDNMNMRLRYIILNLVYVEKFGTNPFNIRYKGNEPHIDHIYPQSMLKSRLELWSYEINDLGNYRIVGATDNIRKRAELPDSYFGRLKTMGIDIEKHLLLPQHSQNPALLKFDRRTYEQFRDQRRHAIFEIANRVGNPELL